MPDARHICALWCVMGEVGGLELRPCDHREERVGNPLRPQDQQVLESKERAHLLQERAHRLEAERAGSRMEEWSMEACEQWVRDVVGLPE